MIRSKTVRLFSILAALIAFGAPTVHGTSEEIRPFRTIAQFSKTSFATPWKAYVLTSTGKRAYRLSFDPEYGPNREVIGLDLKLVDVRTQGSSSSNLLSPPLNWHGLQPYMFLGKDLAQGPDKTIDGRHRKLKVERRKLLVQMDILNATVSPLPNGDDQIDQLELAITLDNLPT